MKPLFKILLIILVIVFIILYGQWQNQIGYDQGYEAGTMDERESYSVTLYPSEAILPANTGSKYGITCYTTKAYGKKNSDQKADSLYEQEILNQVSRYDSGKDCRSIYGRGRDYRTNKK